MSAALCRGVTMTRRIEKPEWTVGGGYEVGGNMDKLRVSWARDIVLPKPLPWQKQSLRTRIGDRLSW